MKKIMLMDIKVTNSRPLNRLTRLETFLDQHFTVFIFNFRL
jgi:hypothetical protein